MGSEARARLGLAALLAGTLLGFSRVFQEGNYPGPAMLGMLIAVGIAMVTRRFGLPSWLSIVLSISALAWYLMVIFSAQDTFFGFPTLAAGRGLITAIRGAYENSGVDYAPVPLRAGYVALTVAAMWLLSTVGELATFRWRRPSITAVAATALFSFLLVIGIPKGASFFAMVFLLGLLAYLGLESAHRLRRWGEWVSAWTARRWDSEVSTAPLARRMGAACLAAALVAPVFLPAIGKGILKWRGGAGFGGGGSIDTLVSLAPKLIEQSKTVLFKVRATEPGYWRLITLTNFDGNSWHPEAQRASLTNERVANISPAPQPGRAIIQEYDIEGLEGDQIPAAVLPETITFSGSNAEEYEDQVEFNPVTGDMELNTPLTDGIRYTVQSLTPNITFQSMQKAKIPSIDVFQRDAESYTFLPENSYLIPSAFCPGPSDRCQSQDLRRSRVYKIAQRWTKGAKNPFEEMLMLQNRFRGQFIHRLPGATEVAGVRVEPRASADYLVNFLTKARVGYCQQFATAFAVLARMLGYPTRVSVGFLPGETQTEDPDLYTVRGNDAHAWPEVYFDKVGWVMFEPTPRGAAPPPGYTLERLPGAGVNPPQLDPNTIGARRARQRLRGLRDTLGRQGGRAVEDPRREKGIPEWQKSFLRFAALVIALIVVFLLSVPLLKKMVSRRRYARAADANQIAGAAFAEFEQEASDLASRRMPSESASAFVRRLTSLRKVERRPATRLADLFEKAAYAPEAIDARLSQEAIRLAKQLRHDLWSSAGWWERANRLFDPTVLLLEWAPKNGRPKPRGVNERRAASLEPDRVGHARGSTRPGAGPR